MAGALIHSLSSSSAPAAQAARRLHRGIRMFTLPRCAPVVAPVMWTFVAARTAWHFAYRVLVCEPFFKAACTSCGRGVRTDVYIHWIQGRGNLIVGDDVLMDGKCSISFASRYSANPTLTIGDHSGIGHGCRFTIGKRITIGQHCRIAADVWMFDSPGHPLDAAARQAGDAPRPDDVRPITIGDNVWIGGRAIIHPGVTIGDHSIVSAGAVVMSDVPAHAVVAGNPARAVMNAARPASAATAAPRIPA
jgi:acetyltransferase-like isoleucine patch superfamily enzyme